MHEHVERASTEHGEACTWGVVTCGLVQQPSFWSLRAASCRQMWLRVQMLKQVARAALYETVVAIKPCVLNVSTREHAHGLQVPIGITSA